MIIYNNYIDLINDIPKFLIPYKYFSICWYIKLKNNKDYEIITPDLVCLNLKNIYGDFNFENQKYLDDLDDFINFIKSSHNFKCLRNGKIISNLNQC